MPDGELDEISKELGSLDARLSIVEEHAKKAVEKDGCMQRIDHCERMVRCIFLLFRYSFFFIVCAAGIGFGIFSCIATVIVKTAPDSGVAFAGIVDSILRMFGR